MTKIFCFIGVDGVGKSTIINETKLQLENKGYSCKTCYMGRGEGKYKIPIINFIARAYAKYSKSDSKEYNSDKSTSEIKQPHLNSTLYLLIYFLDLWARYLDAKFFSDEDIVLMDRYFYDGLILSNKPIEYLSMLVPEPTGSFILVAPPQVINDRKDEATYEEIMEYYKDVERLKNKFAIQEVDNSGDKGQATAVVIQKINEL